MASDQASHLAVKGKQWKLHDHGIKYFYPYYLLAADGSWRWPFNSSVTALSWWVYNVEMEYPALYVKLSAIYAASVLFPITKIHEPRKQKEIRMPLFFIISIDPLGNWGFSGMQS